MTDEQKPALGKLTLMACVAALGGFLFGFDSGVINGTVSALQEAFDASDIGTGFNVASMLLGCAAGAFLAGRIADMFGRKSALFMAAILFAISAFGSGIAGSSGEFVIYRLIGGFAVGAASIICPAYISEISPKELRGRLATLQQMAIVLGLFVAFLSNYLLANFTGGNPSAEFWLGFQTWQWMFWVELIPITLFFIGLFIIPESPRYLVADGKPEKAESILARLTNAAKAKVELEEIRKSLRQDHKPSFRDLYNEEKKRVYRILWVGLGLASLQQLVGINVIFYYGEVLWRAAGFSAGDALLINVIGGGINIASTVVAIMLIDKLGRRPLLMIGSIGMTIFLGIVAIVFSQAERLADGTLNMGDTAGIIALVAANLYIVCFGISWGPVMWVLLGEIFPNQMRGAALSLAGLTQWGSNFLVTITFPPLLAAIGLGGAYGVYAIFAAISAVFAIKFVNETKGRALESMTGD